MTSPRHDPYAVAPARIVDIQSETPAVRTYTIELTDAEDRGVYNAKPGQFNMLYLPGIGEAAISLSRCTADGEPLVHTIHAVGNVTRTLANAAEGYSLGVRGPFGSSWPIEQAMGRDLILVAGGIGLAPMRPVVETVVANRKNFGRVSLLVGARSPDDLLYGQEFEPWKSAEIDVQTTVDRASHEWSGHVGVVTLLLDRLRIASPQGAVMFCCGPEVMMTYAIRSARQRGVPRENLWLSLERNMDCAIGHCGHCQLGPHFFCKDGPVLRYDQVNQLMRVDSL